MGKKGGRSSGSRMSGRGQRVLPADATRFSGRIVGSLANNSTQPIETVLAYGQYASVAPNASVAYCFSNKAATASVVGVQQAPGWADYANLYDEYRVLGLELQVAPGMVVLDSATRVPVLMLGGFRSAQDVPPLPTSVVQAAQYDDFVYCNLVAPTHHAIRMVGTDEAGWQSTDTTATLDEAFSGVFVFNNGGASNTSVPAVVKWRVQFRSTKATALTRAVRLGLSSAAPRSGDEDALLDRLERAFSKLSDRHLTQG